MQTTGSMIDTRLLIRGCKAVGRDRGRIGPGVWDRGRDSHDRRSYMLLDERGEPVGKIVAADARPMVGKHAPTFYVRRDCVEH